MNVNRLKQPADQEHESNLRVARRSLVHSRSIEHTIMVHDPRVGHLLSRLGGVYRDPGRLDRDASAILKSSVGTNLQPIISSMVENNGESYNVLVLQGTIAIHFRGQTYQILIDMYLPSGYPRSPPNCFVRLAPNMYLKSNHPHVGSDGKVYLPYLHEWDIRHNLIEMVVAISSVFSAEPPVFTRPPRTKTPPPPPPPPPPHRSSASSAASANSFSPTRPTPPRQSVTNLIAANSMNGGCNDWRLDSDAQEAILAVEIAQANEAAEAARRAEQVEKEEKAAAARAKAILEQQARQQLRLEAQRKQALDTKLTVHMKHLRGDVEQQLLQLAKEEQRLEHSNAKIAQQFELYKKRKENAENYLAKTTKAIQEVQEWLAEKANSASDVTNKPKVTESTVDDLVHPSCELTAQMLDLAATNAALGDALYFLDRALYRGVVDCDEHLKQVRALAKRQFLTRAHMLKIQKLLR